MPVYNGERYIRESIASILHQTYQDFELLIIDDCSTDDSIQIIKSISDERIKLIQNRNNLGQSATMNIGLKLSNGNYIARLDQDDLSDHTRLKRQLDYLKNHKCSVLGTWTYKINSNSELIGRIEHPITHNKIQNALGIECALSHSSVIIKKDDIISIGGYSKNFKIGMDWDLWIRVIKNGYRIRNIPEFLTSLRFHDLQASNSNTGKKTLVKEKLIILDDSKSLIRSKPNYNAYIGWRYYYEFQLYLQDLLINNGYKNFILKVFRLKGLIECLKLIFYHKIIRRPNYLYDTTII